MPKEKWDSGLEWMMGRLQLHECMFRQGDAEQLKVVLSPRMPHRQDCHTSHCPAVRRDRSELWKKLRQNQRKASSETGSSEAPVQAAERILQLKEFCSSEKKSARASAELKIIYERVVEIHAPLALHLAQHKGLLQFGLEFEHRTPPIEFRALLPELETMIEDRLNDLLRTVEDLQEIEQMLPHDADPATRNHILQVRDGICQWSSTLHTEAQEAFSEQQCQMRNLAAASPRFSPMLRPLGSLGKKLAAVIPSPPGSRFASPQSVCTEPYANSEQVDVTWSNLPSGIATPEEIESAEPGKSFSEEHVPGVGWSIDSHLADLAGARARPSLQKSGSFLNAIEAMAVLPEPASNQDSQKEGTAFSSLFAFSGGESVFSFSGLTSSTEDRPRQSLSSIFSLSKELDRDEDALPKES